jgi:hypothetical protein
MKELELLPLFEKFIRDSRSGRRLKKDGPSPTFGTFTLDMTAYPAGPRQIYIYDQLGQTVYQDRMQISAQLSSGIYTVSIAQGAQRSYTRLLVD